MLKDKIKPKKIFFTLLIALLVVKTGFSQVIYGTVTDKDTKEPIPGAFVGREGLNPIVPFCTDGHGYFEFNIRKTGKVLFIVNHPGYTTFMKELIINDSINKMDIELEEEIISLESLVILGSRANNPRSNLETTAPVDQITRIDLANTGKTDVTQMLHFIAPSFNSSKQTGADGTDHVDPATLRGLGPDQVLILLNGKRLHNQALVNVNGTVGRGSTGTDINNIPAIALENIEVLRDGASSQYGSDAIAGVINLKIREDIGTSVQTHYGKQYMGDGQNIQIGAYHGIRLNHRGGMLGFALDVRLREGTNRVGKYTGPVYVNWNVNRSTGESDASFYSRRNNLYQQDEALVASNGFNRENNLLLGNSTVNNFSGMVNFKLPVQDKFTIYSTLNYNYRLGNSAGLYRYPYQTTQVIADLYPNGFLPKINSTIQDLSSIIGMKGSLGNNWHWDLSNTYGFNFFRFDASNTNNASQYILGSNAPGKFYAGTLGFQQNTTDLNINKDIGSLLGLETFNIGAGISYRVDRYTIEPGEEASWKNYDPSSGKGGGSQVFQGFQPTNVTDKTRSVVAAYVDIESDINEHLLLDIASRFENYSDFGSNFAGKFSFRYKFGDFLCLRGSISNGFRAPSLQQTYYNSISTVFVTTSAGLIPREQGTFRNDSDIAKLFGIPSLKAEKSINYSIGFTSKVNKFLTLTVDGYLIDIQDRIVLTNQFTRGNAGVGLIVANYLDQSGFPELNAAVFFTNAVSTQTKGLDIAMTVNPNLKKGSLLFNFAANFTETKVIGDPKVSATLPNDLFSSTLFNRQERSRLERCQPRSKIILGINYQINKFNLHFRTTRFGEVSILNGTNPLLDEDFSAKFVMDLYVGFQISHYLKITLGANNLLDTYPDKLKHINYPTPNMDNNPTLDNSSFGRFPYSRNATQFGFNGGYYFISLDFDF